MKKELPQKPRADHRRLIVLGIGLMTLILYLPVRNHFFVRMDDGDYVMENPQVLGGLTWSSIRWAFTTFHASNWHPLTWISHMIDCQLFGTFAGAHHLISVIFHAINAALLFVLWNRLTGKVWPAAFVAALFAWHPLNVESVAWASERKNVLSMLFFLLSLLAYEKHVRNQKPATSGSLSRLLKDKNGILVIVYFALGLMAKPILVTLPFVLILLDFWPLQRIRELRPGGKQLRHAILEKVPLFLITALSCLLAFASERQASVVSLEHLPLGHRCVSAVLGYNGYLCKTFWPADLAAFYPFRSNVKPAEVILAVFILSAISVAAFGLRKKAPCLLLGWCWFVGTLVPVIGLVQVGIQSMADRHAYLPLIGIFVMIAYGAAALIKTQLHRALAAALAGAAMMGCLLVTHHQIPFWKDSELLFRRALAVTTRNAKAEAGLAFTLFMNGNSEEAVEHFHAAIKISPEDAANYNNLAIVLEAMGRHEEALQMHREAIKLQPTDPKFHWNLGILLAHDQHYDEAFACFNEAHRLSPLNPIPYLHMGETCLAQGRSRDAIGHFREALKLSPDDIESLIALSHVLAADPDPELRNGQEAVALAEQASTLTGSLQIPISDVLAMAYAEAGKFDLARLTISNVLDQIPGADTNQAFAELRNRLQLYEAHQPFRFQQTNQPAPPKQAR